MSDLALISREGVRVRVGGRDFHLPYRPAAEWMSAARRSSGLVSQLARPEDRDVMIELVMDVPGAVEDLHREGRRILTEATGRKWYQTEKLINTSVNPEVLGRLLLAGLDPWQRSIGEWCAAVYALAVKGLDDKKRTRLDFSLALPPPGFEDEWDDDGGADPEATMSAVQELMGQ